MMSYEDVPIDVYCKFTQEGDLIPLKIRMPDDEGELQEYRIKAYREVSFVPDSKKTDNGTFECKIDVYGREKIIKIIYMSYDRKWVYRPERRR